MGGTKRPPFGGPPSLLGRGEWGGGGRPRGGEIPFGVGPSRLPNKGPACGPPKIRQGRRALSPGIDVGCWETGSAPPFGVFKASPLGIAKDRRG